ncbi:hypothetical protein IW262DRAFT_515453 [Armillaria fumosa]|nr:hypothetical protein IW262DRAFT_515453 [Armillaria fumosa]
MVNVHRKQIGLYVHPVYQGQCNDSVISPPVDIATSGIPWKWPILPYILFNISLNVPFSYARSLEHSVEKMENLHHKMIHPGAHLKEDLRTVEILPVDATSMLPSMVHSLSLNADDRKHALEEFEECAVYQYHRNSGSLRFVQEAMVVKVAHA